MPEISGYGVILLFLIGGLGFILTTVFASWVLRPSRPNDEKLTTYESGEDPIGSAWGNFNIRFFVIALVFLLFEVELVFLFPWATVFANEELNQATEGLWGKFALVETFVFIAILAVGLLYVWRKGMLDWVKPRPKASGYQSKIPKEAYQQVNEKY